MNQVSKLQNQYLHSKTGDGTLPQVTHGRTFLIGVGGAQNTFK